MKRKAGRGRRPTTWPAGPRRFGPQGQVLGAASAGAQRWRQLVEFRFRRDLYSQESTFALVCYLHCNIMAGCSIYLFMEEITLTCELVNMLV